VAQRDLVIVGGGPVGAALAALLADSGLSLTLLEARSLDPDDPRSIALSYGSAMLLQRIGVWDALQPRTAIESIHVSQAGGWGRTLIEAVDQGVPALGYVCTYGAVHAALDRRAGAAAAIDRRSGARAVALAAHRDGMHVEIESERGRERIDARLVVVADGGRVSAALFDARERDYGQSAVVADVATDVRPTGRAYERFSAQGPIALLPSGAGYALVWTVRADAVEALRACDERQFLGALQQAFGERAGRFVRSGPRTVFPLLLRVAQAPRGSRVVLLGNAAQTLHPVAGQGLNLGLRDADALAALVRARPGVLDDGQFAHGFHAARRGDRMRTVGITDSLVRLFSNDLSPLRTLRGCGLTLLDLLPPAKRAFAQRMMFGS